ncbi:DUF2075 domain-containing protein [Ligilactobacillus animalis]|nr:DUF2075 domain-containing protein [Ligilactobacillus animalis]
MDGGLFMRGSKLPKLTNEQSTIYYLSDSQNLVILGAAGSGKSLVATYRALYLEEKHPNAKILLLTMNHEISQQIEQSIMRQRPKSNIRVSTMYSYCQELMKNYYPDKIKFTSITIKENKQAIDEAINSVQEEMPNETLWNKISEDGDNSFFANEITWMQENGIPVSELGRKTYLTIPRIGRGSERISGQQRKIMYEVYCKYYEKRHQINPEKLFQFNDIYSFIVSLRIPDAEKSGFIIIDEVQDFTPVMFQALNNIIAPNGYWCVVGDVSQNIFGQRLSWSSLGLENVRKYTLSKNYRNSYEIGKLAESMLATGYFDNKSADFVAPIPSPENKCGLPKLRHFKGDYSGIIHVLRDKLRNESVSVITMDFRESAQLKKQFEKAGIPFTDNINNYSEDRVYLQTINKVKGLEFDTVLIYCLDSANFRDNTDIIDKYSKTLKPDLMVDEDKAIVAKRIYVAITRARKNLIMYYKKTPLDFLFNKELIESV